MQFLLWYLSFLTYNLETLRAKKTVFDFVIPSVIETRRIKSVESLPFFSYEI